MTDRVAAVILAAGRGSRVGAAVNKALIPVAGCPVLIHSLRAFARVAEIDELIAVAAADEVGEVCRLVAAEGVPVRVVAGGATRRASALAGVDTAAADLVLVHDAARPCVSEALIGRVLAATRRHGACVPVLELADTVRDATMGFLVRGTVCRRAGSARMQTPQGARRDELLAALACADEGVPDDAEALLQHGVRVATVVGEPANLKITTPGDLRMVESLLLGGGFAATRRGG